MKLTQEQTAILIVAAVFASFVALYVYLWVQEQNMRIEIEAQHEELSRLLEQEQAHDTLVTFLQLTEHERRELSSYLVGLDNPSPYLALLEDVAGDAGVTVEVETLAVDDNTAQKKPKSGAPVEPVKDPRLRVVLNVAGSWPQVHHFLSLLERVPYVTLVEKVAITQDKKLGQGVWSGQIHLSILTRE